MRQRRVVDRPRLRTLEQGVSERHASWLELFFDLVFVLAVSQVAHVLSGHTDLGGFIKYTALFVPIWYTWVGFTFYGDRFETEETAFRVLIFAGMLSVTGLSLALGSAFTVTGDVPAVVCYILVLGVLIALYARAAYYVPLARPYCRQYLMGLGFSVILFAVSLLFDAPLRYAIWAAAVGLQFAIPFINIRATRLIPIDRSHIPERFGLFTIIVLGEAVIAAATGVANVAWGFTTIATATAGFAMAACIWWINFDFVEDNAIRSKSLTPRFVYLYGHFFIVASIVAIGVGVEHAITESQMGHLALSTRALISGGIAVYLAAITVVRMVTGVCNLLYARVASLAASLVFLYLGEFVMPLIFVSAQLLLLIGGIWVESRYGIESEKEEDQSPHLVPCDHADQATVFKARSEDGCEECRKNNYKWVHLRLCLGCGHVGCCDTSVHKHATKHYHASGHAIMASLEAGENWAWCYTDERFVPLAKHVK
ncbi:MAG: low temperature requirement protein A [Acidobacteriota bacterium]